MVSLIEKLNENFIPLSKINSNIDKITNKIYLGNKQGAKDFDFFEKEGINYVISLIGKDSPFYDPKMGIKRKIIYIFDSPGENLLQYMKECIEYIEEAERNVYIHCMGGISRSAAIVIAYIMWKYKANFNDSLMYVISKRKDVEPNEGFKDQLKVFEKILSKYDYDLGKINDEDVKWDKTDDDYWG